jgi:hypothetical protein
MSTIIKTSFALYCAVSCLFTPTSTRHHQGVENALEVPKQAEASQQGFIAPEAKAEIKPKTPPEPEKVIPLPIVSKIIECETGGKSQTVLDVNGKYSRGILQFQDDTWEWFSQLSGITGSPLNENDAIKMANWAFTHGHQRHWYNCSKRYGLL